MRKELLLQPCVVFARIRSGGDGTSAASGIGRDQGSGARNSFLVVMFITGRSDIRTCVALGQRSGYRGQKVLRYRIP